jgi:hypothetical protein
LFDEETMNEAMKPFTAADHDINGKHADKMDKDPSHVSKVPTKHLQALHHAFTSSGTNDHHVKAISGELKKRGEKPLSHSDGQKMFEAVGTAAKYAGKTGLMGGKYTHNDRAIAMKGDKFQKWRDKQAAKRDAEHKAQDPKHAAAGYAKHMVDTNKAKKKAAARGVDASHLNWKHTNGVKRGKLPEAADRLAMIRAAAKKVAAQKAAKEKQAERDAKRAMKGDKDLFGESAHEAMREYGTKHGGIDKTDFHQVAGKLQHHKETGNAGAIHDAAKHIHGMDTDPRDKALDIIKKHDPSMHKSIVHKMSKMHEATDYNKDGKIDKHEKDHAKEKQTFKDFNKRLKKLEKEEMHEAALNELSKDTLSSYSRKASDQAGRTGAISTKKQDKRIAGIKKASEKLAEADNPPFTPDPPKNKKPQRNSDGSVTSPMSKARQLAKQAIKNAEKTVAQHKEGVEFDDEGNLLEAKNKITFHNFMGATKKKQEKKGGDNNDAIDQV